MAISRCHPIKSFIDEGYRRLGGTGGTARGKVLHGIFFIFSLKKNFNN
jgi:hypothetical protein